MLGKAFAVWFLLLTLPFLLSSSADAALKTNWKKALVPLEEIRSGGPPPDGIPAIDKPKFVTVQEALEWLNPREPVLALELNGEARAYPLQIMIWHEIVNDVVGGVPVAVTFCPLCNSALVFDRRVNGETLDFGTSGMLYKSDLVMYDRKTHSLWVQMEGKAVVGDLAGTRLKVYPAAIVGWGEWKEASPFGRVLSRDTGHLRAYGLNPYVGYDTIDQSPFLYQGSIDPRFPPMERVLALSYNGEDKAYPFRLLTQRKVVHDTVGGAEVVILFKKGTASALDEPVIATSRDVGATGVFFPVVDGRRLGFAVKGEGFVDQETGSHWNILGKATSGPLKGKALERVPHVDTFWFVWSAFKPKTTVYGTAR